MDWSGALREQLQKRAAAWATKTGLPSYNSTGESQTVLFEPTPCGTKHGNFESASWAAINADMNWQPRLSKTHSQKIALPQSKREKARELDSSTSSDALLMNCFCFPNAAVEILNGLGLPAHHTPLKFGFKAHVPLASSGFDRTEVDLGIGALRDGALLIEENGLLIEAKLTEKSFTTSLKSVLLGYRDFTSVFDILHLPQDSESFEGYQLIRNVLAAHDLGAYFIVLLDARRPDLLQEWWKVHGAIRDVGLRARCGFRTWQQVAAAAPAPLRGFLEEKYGL